MRNRFEPQRCRACSQGTDGIGSAPCHQNQYMNLENDLCNHVQSSFLAAPIELQQRTDDARAGFKDCQWQRWYRDTWRDLKRSASGTVPCCAKHVLASFRLQLQEPFFRPRSNSEGPEPLHWPAEARRASCTQAVRQAHLADLNFAECS